MAVAIQKQTASVVSEYCFFMILFNVFRFAFWAAVCVELFFQIEIFSAVTAFSPHFVVVLLIKLFDGYRWHWFVFV